MSQSIDKSSLGRDVEIRHAEDQASGDRVHVHVITDSPRTYSYQWVATALIWSQPTIRERKARSRSIGVALSLCALRLASSKVQGCSKVLFAPFPVIPTPITHLSVPMVFTGWHIFLHCYHWVYVPLQTTAGSLIKGRLEPARARRDFWGKE